MFLHDFEASQLKNNLPAAHKLHFIIKKREKQYLCYKKYGVHQRLSGLFDLVWLQYSSSARKKYSSSTRACSKSPLYALGTQYTILPISTKIITIFLENRNQRQTYFPLSTNFTFFSQIYFFPSFCGKKLNFRGKSEFYINALYENQHDSGSDEHQSISAFMHGMYQSRD